MVLDCVKLSAELLESGFAAHRAKLAVFEGSLPDVLGHDGAICLV